jgi:hypothetical protein
MTGKKIMKGTPFFLDAKAIMEHAIFHLQGGSKIDMRMAIILAHHAVELSIRKKAQDLGRNPYNFPQVLNALKKADVLIPYERRIEELNRVRTLTQHYGTTPSDNDARTLVSIARDFLIEFWQDSFRIDYQRISMVDLIRNDEIRATLIEARGALEKQEYEISTAKSVLAIYQTKWWVQKNLDGRASLPLFVEDPFPSMYARAVAQKLDFLLDMVLSGPFTNKILRLKKDTGIVWISIPSGQPTMQKLRENECSYETASVAEDLAIEYALWAEQTFS